MISKDQFPDFYSISNKTIDDGGDEGDERWDEKVDRKAVGNIVLWSCVINERLFKDERWKLVDRQEHDVGAKTAHKRDNSRLLTPSVLQELLEYLSQFVSFALLLRHRLLVGIDKFCVLNLVNII